jgi:hypothetical protein
MAGGSTGPGSILDSALSPGDGKSSLRSAVLGILLVLGGVAAAGYYFETTRVNSAIDKITTATSPAQKEQLLNEARNLIASETDKGQKAFYQGRMEEAQDRAAASLGYYRFGAATGNKPSKERIIEMLRHPNCAARVEAIHAAGDFRLLEAKAQLERLAAQGGRDDTNSPVVGGCDSQSVAKAVLWMLNRP